MLGMLLLSTIINLLKLLLFSTTSIFWSSIIKSCCGSAGFVISKANTFSGKDVSKLNLMFAPLIGEKNSITLESNISFLPYLIFK